MPGFMWAIMIGAAIYGIVAAIALGASLRAHADVFEAIFSRPPEPPKS